MFGKVQETPQKESTPFYPRSPYGVAKLYAYWIVVNYRESYDLFACNGILFNHESPQRGETFVTRKITRGLARIGWGLEECIFLGNLDARRDWGHAKDFVEAQWLMLQHHEPVDFVISTGEQHSVRNFVNAAAGSMGLELEWTGGGTEEQGVVAACERDDLNFKAGDVVVRIDPRYYRPAEVETLLGDSTLARETLGWAPKISFAELVREMVATDLQIAREEALINRDRQDS